MPVELYERGSEWRQWDLHIHTPASFHWKGEKFNGDWSHDRKLVDAVISAMNDAAPAVYALMDYWTFDGWFSLQRRLAEEDAPTLKKTVFPGIELRLQAPMHTAGRRLNAHAIFSDLTPAQTLRDFLSTLRLAVGDRVLSRDGLIALARSADEDHLGAHGFKKADVSEEAKALFIGQTIAEVTATSYVAALKEAGEQHAVGFMPWDTTDGLKNVKWEEHYGYFVGLYKTSPIFESRNLALRDCFLSVETPENAGFLKAFQERLGNVPRLVVAGSDAHCPVGKAGDNDKRGYGDFPSGKATWIKADPTFEGLRQAIREPEKRSFIGARPPKLLEVEGNKTFYIDRIAIGKVAKPKSAGAWLDGTSIPLNADLVAIIGNRGSGKSALADVIALVGNSRQQEHFSFLKKDRFFGKTGDPARDFEATLTWHDTTPETRNLNDRTPANKVEMVRYIPQGHFEALCNAHVTGMSDAFETELRNVIFTHLGEDVRLGALDFAQLIQKQESSFRVQLNEFRGKLARINEDIASIEAQLQPDVKSQLKELLRVKDKQIEEHAKARPAPVAKPTDALTPEQSAASGRIEEITGVLQTLAAQETHRGAASVTLAAKARAIKSVIDRMGILRRAHQQFLDDSASDLALLGLQADAIVRLDLNPKPLQDLAQGIPEDQLKLASEGLEADTAKAALVLEQQTLAAKLNAPQLAYQQSVLAETEWLAKQASLVGDEESPDSQSGLGARIAQIELLPAQLAEQREARSIVAGKIFDVLETQRLARAELFQPVQDIIESNTLIREEYKLQFRAALGMATEALSTSLMSLIKQTSGDFRGAGEGDNFVRALADAYDLGTRGGVLAFAERLHDAVLNAAAQARPGSAGARAILKKDRASTEVYDLIFGLTYLEPRYSLLFQETQIEKLSPGQRGALLLIFYLLVDKGRNPIILDQPEENLDNETVVSLLVPVIARAKTRRQIIMVTHNPNLAVVCDAEQIICSAFDRKNDSKIEYLAGSIENPAINQRVVNVLEGTMPAFNNRRGKYSTAASTAW